MDKVEGKTEELLHAIQDGIEEMKQGFARMDKTMDRIEESMGYTSKKLEGFDKRSSAINNELKQIQERRQR